MAAEHVGSGDLHALCLVLEEDCGALSVLTHLSVKGTRNESHSEKQAVHCVLSPVKATSML